MSQGGASRLPPHCHGALVMAGLGGAGRWAEEKVSPANIIKLLKQISSGKQIRKAKIKEQSRTNKKAGNKISSYVIPSLCAAVSTIVQLYCFGNFLCIKLKVGLWRNCVLCCLTLKRIIFPNPHPLNILGSHWSCNLQSLRSSSLLLILFYLT